MVTIDETVSPFIATVTQYVRVVPTGFIVSGFPVSFYEIPETYSEPLPFDTVSFIPAFYSYDTDALVNEKTLYYKFYCMLVDMNAPVNATANITNELYYINPKSDLTPEQLEADDTCFKNEGKIVLTFHKFYLIKYFTLIY